MLRHVSIPNRLVIESNDLGLTCTTMAKFGTEIFDNLRQEMNTQS
jgi:hypothetical protein